MNSVDFLIDTGAYISAISTPLRNRIRQAEKPPMLLPYKGILISVSCVKVNVGQVLLSIEIEKRLCFAQCLVFEMADDAILDLDFIKKYD